MKLEGDIDELIFDYLEGNLDKEEQEAFDLLRDENETFGHHVRLWQNAYVGEPLPITTDLEERCMIKGRSGTNLLSNAGIIAFMVGVMSFVPSSTSEVAIETNAPEVIVEQVQDQELTPVLQPAGSVTVITPSEPQPVIYRADEISFEPRINDLWKSVPVDIESDVIKPIKVSLPKYNRPRYSEREIERMKRRHLERRRSEEFKAGKVPYVVPLSTKNF